MVSTYLKECFRNYTNSLGLEEGLTYFYGNPITPVMPVEIEKNSVMIIGAYPTARFTTIKKERFVPVADISAPFSDEKYFNGTTIYPVLSGKELSENYLEPLGIKRNQCWITNLVKIFLFYDKHVEKYKRLGNENIKETRSMFMELAKKSVYWINREIEIARPKIIITLGQEVTATMFNVSEDMGKKFLDGNIRQKHIDGSVYKIISLPHPGIIMRKSKNEQSWSTKYKNVILPNAKICLNEVLGNTEK